MGEQGDVAADADKLKKVVNALHEERHNVKSVRLVPPTAAMFGGSARGEWLEAVVRKGAEGIQRSLDETADGLHKTSEGINGALKGIQESDAYAGEVAAQKLIEAVELFSNPLVIFSKETQNKLFHLGGPEAF